MTPPLVSEVNNSNGSIRLPLDQSPWRHVGFKPPMSSLILEDVVEDEEVWAPAAAEVQHARKGANPASLFPDGGWPPALQFDDTGSQQPRLRLVPYVSHKCRRVYHSTDDSLLGGSFAGDHRCVRRLRPKPDEFSSPGERRRDYEPP